MEEFIALATSMYVPISAKFPRSKFNPTASFQQELVFPRVEFPSYARMLVMRYSERVRGYQFDGVCVRFLGYCDVV